MMFFIRNDSDLFLLFLEVFLSVIIVVKYLFRFKCWNSLLLLPWKHLSVNRYLSFSTWHKNIAKWTLMWIRFDRTGYETILVEIMKSKSYLESDPTLWSKDWIRIPRFCVLIITSSPNYPILCFNNTSSPSYQITCFNNTKNEWQ